MSKTILGIFQFILTILILFTMYIMQIYSILPSLYRVAIFVVMLILILINWLRFAYMKSRIKIFVSIFFSIIICIFFICINIVLNNNINLIKGLSKEEKLLEVSREDINTQTKPFNILLSINFNKEIKNNNSGEINTLITVNPKNKRILFTLIPEFLNKKSIKEVNSDYKKTYNANINFNIKTNLDTIDSLIKYNDSSEDGIKDIIMNNLLSGIDIKNNINQSKDIIIQKISKIFNIKNLLRFNDMLRNIDGGIITNLKPNHIYGLMNSSIENIFVKWNTETQIDYSKVITDIGGMIFNNIENSQLNKSIINKIEEYSR